MCDISPTCITPDLMLLHSSILHLGGLCSVVYLCYGRKDSSRIQVHRVAQFYRKRRKGVLERPKTPQTQSSLKFAGDDSVILISVCASASLRFRFPT